MNVCEGFVTVFVTVSFGQAKVAAWLRSLGSPPIHASSAADDDRYRRRSESDAGRDAPASHAPAALACPARLQVSGARFWGFLRRRFGTAEAWGGALSCWWLSRCASSRVSARAPRGGGRPGDVTSWRTPSPAQAPLDRVCRGIGSPATGRATASDEVWARRRVATRSRRPFVLAGVGSLLPGGCARVVCARPGGLVERAGKRIVSSESLSSLPRRSCLFLFLVLRTSSAPARCAGNSSASRPPQPRCSRTTTARWCSWVPRESTSRRTGEPTRLTSSGYQRVIARVIFGGASFSFFFLLVASPSGVGFHSEDGVKGGGREPSRTRCVIEPCGHAFWRANRSISQHTFVSCHSCTPTERRGRSESLETAFPPRPPPIGAMEVSLFVIASESAQAPSPVRGPRPVLQGSGRGSCLVEGGGLFGLTRERVCLRSNECQPAVLRPLAVRVETTSRTEDIGGEVRSLGGLPLGSAGGMRCPRRRSRRRRGIDRPPPPCPKPF